MINKKVKYQSVKIKYPKKLYLFTSWVLTENKKLWLYPNTKLYKTPQAALRVAKKVYQLRKEIVLDHVLIQTLELIETMPLKKEYWENPAVSFNIFERIGEFLKAYQNHENYKVMVTPLKAKSGELAAACPFPNSVDIKTVEAFMCASEWYVDSLGDSFAFYTFGEPISINLITGKVFDKNRKINKEVILN